MANRKGSIQRRLQLVALVPILAILPLGIRSSIQDVTTWNQARQSAADASQAADGAAVVQAIRAEWLAAIDLTAITSSDFVGISPVFEQRSDAIQTDTEQRLTEAVATSDALLGQHAPTSTAFDGRLAALDRVDEGRIIPAELDLFYSRAISDWEQEVGLERMDSMAAIDREVLLAEQTRLSVTDVDESLARLRHELTVAADRLFVGGGVAWGDLDDRSDDVAEALASVDGIAFPTSADWNDVRLPLQDVLIVVDDLVDRSPAASEPSIPNDVELIEDSRDALADVTEQLIVQQEVSTSASVVVTEQLKNEAARSLALSGLLLLVAVGVTAFIAAKTTRWIAEPIKEAAQRARRVSDGDLDHVSLPATSTAPTEVQALLTAFDGVTDTVKAIEAQATAITNGDLDDPALDRRLPGNLGQSLESSIGRWRETTVRLEHELSHDPVTDLASLRFLIREAEEMAAKEPVAVAVVALDHFKGVNDAAGRTTGDRVLRRVAQRIEGSSPVDAITARLWSDEFAVLVPASQLDELTESVESIMESLLSPFSVDGTSWRLGATIGLASGPAIDQVLNDASVAARHGKRSGGGCVVHHDDEFSELLDRRAKIEAELIEAMDRDELEMWYQPVFELATREVVGLEALVRWPQPDGSMRAPDEFIGIAEESDLIVDLDSWVLNTVCKQIAQWSGTPMAGLRVAVNISGRHVLRPDLVSRVDDACLEYGIDPASLGLEVTESYLADDLDIVRANLLGLRSLGIEILLDDFGTGYSSLAYVRDLPFDVLKIDRAFVSKLGQEAGHAERLIGAIVAMAAELDLDTIAEGAESREDVEALALLGCGYVQGFGLSRPKPVGPELIEICSTNRAAYDAVTTEKASAA